MPALRAASWLYEANGKVRLGQLCHIDEAAPAAPKATVYTWSLLIAGPINSIHTSNSSHARVHHHHDDVSIAADHEHRRNDRWLWRWYHNRLDEMVPGYRVDEDEDEWILFAITIAKRKVPGSNPSQTEGLKVARLHVLHLSMSFLWILVFLQVKMCMFHSDRL